MMIGEDDLLDGLGTSNKRLKLSERLRTVAGFIEQGAKVADIGTDHGYLPVYLAKSGRASRIIASDVSGESLKAAIRSADKSGVANQITFICAPGLTGINEDDVDTIVVAGLGGETIIGILAAAPWLKRGGVRLVLQPQTKTDILYSWLKENGYVINGAKLTREKGRYYTVIKAEANTVTPCSDDRGKYTAKFDRVEDMRTLRKISSNEFDESRIPEACKSEMSLLLFLKCNNDQLLPGYVDELIRRTRKVAEGIKKSSASGCAEIDSQMDMLLELRSMSSLCKDNFVSGQESKGSIK